MKKRKIKYDGMTEKLLEIFGKLPPRIGGVISAIYLWKPMMFNFMMVGASGLCLSWFLYEQMFRNLMIGIWGGTFMAMAITTLLVFFWNYFWNWRFSLSMEAQVANMSKQDLLELQEKVMMALSQNFDHKGERIDE